MIWSWCCQGFYVFCVSLNFEDGVAMKFPEDPAKGFYKI
jgi:hypothetical protein